jgi:hypothetical protein
VARESTSAAALVGAVGVALGEGRGTAAAGFDAVAGATGAGRDDIGASPLSGEALGDADTVLGGDALDDDALGAEALDDGGDALDAEALDGDADMLGGGTLGGGTSMRTSAEALGGGPLVRISVDAAPGDGVNVLTSIVEELDTVVLTGAALLSVITALRFGGR